MQIAHLIKKQTRKQNGGTVMKGLTFKIYTNHCVYATMITALNHAPCMIWAQHIMIVSVHRDEPWIKSYSGNTSTDQKQKQKFRRLLARLCHVLQLRKFFNSKVIMNTLIPWLMTILRFTSSIRFTDWKTLGRNKNIWVKGKQDGLVLRVISNYKNERIVIHKL